MYIYGTAKTTTFAVSLQACVQHYEQLCQLYDGVPLIVAWGKPVSGKTTAAKAAMALIGQQDSVGGKQAQPN